MPKLRNVDDRPHKVKTLKYKDTTLFWVSFASNIALRFISWNHIAKRDIKYTFLHDKSCLVLYTEMNQKKNVYYATSHFWTLFPV